MRKLHMLASTTDTINTAFVLQWGETVLVVDGGFPHEAEHLHRVLRELGGKVDAWFLTHAHDDHISALFTMLEQYDDIQVGKVYYHFPSDEFLSRMEPRQRKLSTQELLDTLRRTLAQRNIPVVTVETGDCYTFDGFCVRVLRTPDETITHKGINNASCVYRVELPRESILFLGDLGKEGGHQLLKTTPPELLRADYVQMAHHGQNGCDRAFYEAVAPEICIWPTPTWLWNNDAGKGYNTHSWQTVIVQGWMNEIGVKTNYIAKDGDQVCEL